MTRLDAETCVDSVIDGLDEEIREALDEVEIFIVEGREDPELRRAIAHAGFDRALVRRDFRGLFLGRPAAALEDPSEVPTLPTGAIVLNCTALEGLDEVRDTLAHEMGHALGMSEEEVENLGLG